MLIGRVVVVPQGIKIKMNFFLIQQIIDDFVGEKENLIQILSLQGAQHLDAFFFIDQF